jgi:hypothetical protein
MIHVPHTMEATVGQWVANYQEAWRLMEQISQRCLKRFLHKKEALKGRRL